MVSDLILSRNFNQFYKTLYHGTSSMNYDSLIPGVNISFCGEFTDFGKGFYLTSNFQQASRHATRRTKDNDEAIVFVYDLAISRLKEEFKGNVLNRIDIDWAKFIYNNRSKIQPFPHNYDFCLGGVADGRIFDLVNAVDSGLDIEDFYEEIAKYGTYDQLSIHNQDIFTYNIITLKKVVRAYDKQETYDKRGVTK